VTAACQVASSIPPSIATGVVIAVEGPSAAEVDSFSLRTDAGDILNFSVGRLDLAGGGKPAPHLREHLVSGEPIRVHYTESDSGLLAIAYVDEPR
jgi:hypothetical protein